MLTKLRRFVKEYMEAILTALGTFLLGTAFYVYSLRPDSPAMAFWFALTFGALAFAGALWYAWKKERKRDKEREVELAGIKRFLEMTSSEGGFHALIASEINERIEAEKKKKEEEKKDAAS